MLDWGQRVALRKILRLLLGFLLVIIGIIGGFVPILQGWMFLIPGLIILAEFFPPIRRLVDWAKRKAGREHEADDAGIEREADRGADGPAPGAGN
jgi:hypothetical protein